MLLDILIDKYNSRYKYNYNYWMYIVQCTLYAISDHRSLTRVQFIARITFKT